MHCDVPKGSIFPGGPQGDLACRCDMLKFLRDILQNVRHSKRHAKKMRHTFGSVRRYNKCRVFAVAFGDELRLHTTPDDAK